MKKEVFRMERVTYVEHEIIMLEDFNLSVFEGEILGMIPINSHGLVSFLKLLRTNLQLYDGYVYCNEIGVNSWKNAMPGDNRITVISSTVGLVKGLTVADNIFVLRKNFKQEYIRRNILAMQLEPFFAEIGVDIAPDTYIEKLSVFERVVVELLRGIIAGHRLIVCNELETILTPIESKKLHKIIEFYTAKGIGFIYICSHFEEIMPLCDRISLFLNGRIEKNLYSDELCIENMSALTSDYTELIRKHLLHKQKHCGTKEVVGEFQYQFKQYEEPVHLQIHKAECLVIQCMDNDMYYELKNSIVRDEMSRNSFIKINKKKVKIHKKRDVAIIQELASQTMIFPQLSYIDNLCFNVDTRVRGVWLRGNIKRSIRKEYGDIIEDRVYDLRVSHLTEKQKYQLVYMRILLQKPKMVFCVQPFQGADLEHRMYIWKLLERLLNEGISVIILAINLGDTLSIADRLVLINDKSNIYELQREDFSIMPSLVPWQHLYKEEKE